MGDFIGHTMQHLFERLKGHKYSKNNTSLRKYTIDIYRAFNFEQTKILMKERFTKLNEFF